MNDYREQLIEWLKERRTVATVRASVDPQKAREIYLEELQDAKDKARAAGFELPHSLDLAK